MNDEQHTTLLMRMQEQIATVAAKLEAWSSNYDRGRDAQITKAREDAGHFEKLHEEVAAINDALDQKVDRSEIEGFLNIAWLFRHWKSVVFFIMLLSAGGIITIHGRGESILKWLIGTP